MGTNQQNLLTCKNNLKNIISKEKCVFVNKASWNIRGSISFTENGIASNVNKNGEIVIESSTILHELQNSDIPTFIKMDIEGSESRTLYGCRELIKKYCPKLAVSVYHRPEDILDLMNLILRYNNNYKFYLRHYSYVDWDTVLYAVPQ